VSADRHTRSILFRWRWRRSRFHHWDSSVYRVPHRDESEASSPLVTTTTTPDLPLLGTSLGDCSHRWTRVNFTLSNTTWPTRCRTQSNSTYSYGYQYGNASLSNQFYVTQWKLCTYYIINITYVYIIIFRISIKKIIWKTLISNWCLVLQNDYTC